MSGALTFASGLLEGLDKFEAGQTRSQLYRANQQIAIAQARSEAQAGAYNESMVRLRGQALEGQQIANIGANNLQQAGTPSQVVAGTREINEMDALQTRNNALRRAWGFQVQGVSDAFQAAQASRAGTSVALESILTGGAKGMSQADAAGSWL